MDDATQLKNLEALANDPFARVERPDFTVLDKWYGKNPPGLYYCWTKPGSAHYPALNFDSWVCSPISVDAITHDSDGHNFGRLLKFKPTCGASKIWSMPMELLKGDCAELRGALLDQGLEITTDRKTRDRLPEYIQRQHPKTVLKCFSQTGWASSKCFVLPHKSIGKNQIVFQSGFKFTNEFKQSGEFESWQKDIARFAIGNSMLTLALSSAFAAPLLDIVGGESGGIHLVGDSSTGKTTLLNAACSVWGSPSYKRSWRSTANGLEGAAAMFNDGFLALDEISECDPNEIGAIVYSLGNGQGKQRASRTGNARPVAKWRCFILSTGERTVETSMREGRRRIKAGQALRLVDLNCESKFGVFDELHGFGTGAALAESIQQSARMNYGFAGEEFLECLIEYRKLNEIVMPVFEASDGQHRRVANRFGLIALAGELATQFGITGWEQGMATEAAQLAFNRWVDAQPKCRNEEAKIVEALVRFIEAHGESRFAGDGTSYMSTTPLVVRDRAGFKDNFVYYFFPSGLQEALREFDLDRAKDVLFAKKILRDRNSYVKKIGSQNFRVYEIDHNLLNN